MIAYVKIKDYVNDKAFCLPVNLVQSNQDGKFVYVAIEKGNQWIASRRMIKSGMDYNGIVEILEGVAEGDKVISAGYQNIREGEPVIF
jgi:multidrug efflux pump subunit AcrA (membrane-fusion protein)